jgi:hypothetical protein
VIGHPVLLGIDMRAFFRYGAPHAEHEECEHGSRHGKDQKAVKVSQRLSLHVAEIIEACAIE